MALTVTEIEELRSYFNDVMTRADHHAKSVTEIALALIGAIIWKKNGVDPIKVMAHNGKTANVLWVHIGSKRFAFSYNHTTGVIEMRDSSIQGPILHSFDNTVSLSTVRQIFEPL